MTSTTRGEGTLVRIGVIRGDRLVLERTFTHQQTITIGSHAQAAIRIPIAAELDPWPLITPSGGAAVLRIPAAAHAKIACGTDVRSVAGGTEVRIGRGDRGKVRIGDVSVLFQTTVPQRVQSGPPRVEFRGRLLDEEDGLVLAFASVIGTAATVAVVAARLLLPAEDPEVAPPYDRIVWSDLKHVAAVHAPPKAAPAPSPRAPAAAPKPRAIASAPTPGHAPPSSVAPGKSRLVAGGILAIGTHGPDARLSPIKTMMDNIPGGYVALNTDPRKRGPGSPDAPIDIDGSPDALPTGPKLPTTLAAAPELTVTLQYPTPTNLDPATDAEGVTAVIQAHAGELKYCYEKRAKVRSDIGGRVEVTWEIHGGRAFQVSVDQNYTGDDELASCVASQIGRWSFKGVSDTEVTWPFVFKARQ